MFTKVADDLHVIEEYIRLHPVATLMIAFAVAQAWEWWQRFTHPKISE